MRKKTDHKHLFPIINAMVDKAVEDVEEEGEKVSCQKGCDHCCHLLVEVAWEEAYELVEWVNDQDDVVKNEVLEKISKAASEAKRVFSKREDTKIFMEPLDDDIEIPDEVYDDYFYGKKRPCPFLLDGCCRAYEARPTACRLHLVTSDPDICSAEVTDESEFDYPDRFEELREECAPVISAIERKGVWGQLAVMVDSVVKETE